jgi:hypothetical protein
MVRPLHYSKHFVEEDEIRALYLCLFVFLELVCLGVMSTIVMGGGSYSRLVE